MKRLIAAIVLALFALTANAQALSRLDALKKILSQNPQEWIITDTGDFIDLGEGPSPVFEVTAIALPHMCLVAVHPEKTLIATLLCVPKDATPKQETSK